VVTDMLDSYRIPGKQTDLAGAAARCGQLGSDPGTLFGVVQGSVRTSTLSGGRAWP